MGTNNIYKREEKREREKVKENKNIIEIHNAAEARRSPTPGVGKKERESNKSWLDAWQVVGNTAVRRDIINALTISLKKVKCNENVVSKKLFARLLT